MVDYLRNGSPAPRMEFRVGGRVCKHRRTLLQVGVEGGRDNLVVSVCFDMLSRHLSHSLKAGV